MAARSSRSLETEQKLLFRFRPFWPAVNEDIRPPDPLSPRNQPTQPKTHEQPVQSKDINHLEKTRSHLQHTEGSRREPNNLTHHYHPPPLPPPPPPLPLPQPNPGEEKKTRTDHKPPSRLSRRASKYKGTQERVIRAIQTHIQERRQDTRTPLITYILQSNTDNKQKLLAV